MHCGTCGWTACITLPFRFRFISIIVTLATLKHPTNHPSVSQRRRGCPIRVHGPSLAPRTVPVQEEQPHVVHRLRKVCNVWRIGISAVYVRRVPGCVWRIWRWICPSDGLFAVFPLVTILRSRVGQCESCLVCDIVSRAWGPVGRKEFVEECYCVAACAEAYGVGGECGE